MFFFSKIYVNNNIYIIFGSSFSTFWVDFGIFGLIVLHVGQVVHMWVEFFTCESSCGRIFQILVAFFDLGRIFYMWVEFGPSFTYVDRVFYI